MMTNEMKWNEMKWNEMESTPIVERSVAWRNEIASGSVAE
jgi:hypothetical protein